MSLIVEDLSVQVGAFQVGLSIEVPAQTLCCLMGKSGSGKSTLLNAVAGFLPIRSGRIWVGGVEVGNLPPEKRRVSLLFQEPALFPHLTVFQNIEYGLKIQKLEKRVRDGMVTTWLNRLQISELSERYPHQISGGQASRVALARAMVVGFPVILLDEPFAALDVTLKEELRRVLKAIVKESQSAFLMVSHDPEDAKALADQTVRL